MSTKHAKTITRDELVRVLHRAGFAPDRVDEMTGDLPDRFDLVQCGAVLEKFGVTRSVLEDLFGASP